MNYRQWHDTGRRHKLSRQGGWLRRAGRRGATAGTALALVAAAWVAAQVVSPSPASAAPLVVVPVIAAGTSHSCQIQSGHASCWGDNSNGELGNNSTINSSVPVPVFTGGVLNGKTLTQITTGINFTCALDSAGVAYCWGLGANGQLGNSFNATSTVPVRVSGSLTLTQITSGDAFTCGVTSAGVAYCWGLGTNGQLGNGLGTTSNVPVTVSGGFNLAQVAAGSATTCALSSTSVAYCWGAGASGQLGNNSATTSQLTPTPVTATGALSGVTLTQIDVGANFACAVASSTGLAYCWGSNANGQLGTTTTPNNVPVAVTVTATALVGVTLTQISAGGSTTCALAGGTGRAYCWGAGASGQLGNGSVTASQQTAVAVTATGVLTGVTLTQISVGTTFTCAVASKGAADCWGANGSGQLGNPATAAAATVFDVPVAVTSGSTMTAAGNIHSCMLRSGNAYCWGDNSNGELGNNTLTSSSTPVAVTMPGSTTFAQIAAGNNYTCALSTAGVAYCWGFNGQGQLGVSGSTTNLKVPTLVTVGSPGAIPAGTVLTQIATGNTTCALSSAGVAYCWGAGASGQLGNGLTTATQTTGVVVTFGGASAIPTGSTLTDISVTSQTVCALSSTGRAYCWGYGGLGEMGNNTTPTAINSSAKAVNLGASVPLIQISAGYADVCALSSAGVEYCWGGNTDGGLGNNSTTQSTTPVLVTVGSVGGIPSGAVITQIATGDNSNDFACALDTTGAAYCWGYGVDGQLGNSTNTAPQRTPVPVTTSGVLSGVILTQISAGQAHACAMDSTGDVYCWGDNTGGDLGNGNTTGSNTPVIVLPGPPTSVAAFPGNTTAIVYWVAPVAGMLGTDTVTNYTVTLSPGGATCTVSTLTCTITGLTNGVTYTVTVVTNSSQGPSAPSTPATVTPWPPPGTITSGRYHSCTIFSGKAYCWGDDSTGELGNGVTSATLRPTPVAVDTTLTGVGGRTLTQISAGYDFTCALDSVGAAYCWGVNGQGQLGDNTTTTHNVPVAVTGGHTFSQISVGNTHVCAVSAGTVWCWGDDTYGQLGSGTTNSGVPISVTTGTIIQVSTGWYHSCALLTTGAAWCWGANNKGQLGITANGTPNAPVAVSGGLIFGQISAGQLSSCGVASTGAAYCWGDGTNGILGNGGTTEKDAPFAVTMPGGTTFTQISVISNHHACAVDSTGAAWCWGSNSHGQLGNGDSVAKAEKDAPVAVVTTGNWTGTPIITQISTGYQQNCAQDAAGTAYCWGINDHGQLGNNSASESYVTVYVAPQGPTGVGATPGDTTAAISWTAPVFLNNGTITGYTAASTPGVASCSTTTATSCTITGLTDGTLYTITVTVTATTGTASGNTVTVTPVGFLSLTTPDSLTWTLTGNGVTHSVVDAVTADQQFTATDNTGTGAGWHITVSATTFTNGARTLANAGTFVFTGSLTNPTLTTKPSVTCVGSCTAAVDATACPVAITTAASSPPVSTIFGTGVGTGLGVMTIGSIGWWVKVPGSAYAGAYTTTVTLTIVSGP